MSEMPIFSDLQAGWDERERLIKEQSDLIRGQANRILGQQQLIDELRRQIAAFDRRQGATA